MTTPIAPRLAGAATSTPLQLPRELNSPDLIAVMAGGPALARGVQRNPGVKQVQQILGMPQEDQKGDFGPKTEEALSNFQSGAGVPVTKKIDQPTLTALAKFVASYSPAPKTTASPLKLDGEGNVFATIGGKAQKVGANAVGSWALDANRASFSARDGVKEVEGDGMSLYVVDLRSGKATKVMSEYCMVDDVQLAQAKDGRSALIVKMSDSGLGADHVAIVDPARGEVYRKDLSRAQVQGDTVTVKEYGEDEWNGGGTKPIATQVLSLAALLNGRVLSLKSRDTVTTDADLAKLTGGAAQTTPPKATGDIYFADSLKKAGAELQGALQQAPKDAAGGAVLAPAFFDSWVARNFGEAQRLNGDQALKVSALLKNAAPSVAAANRDYVNQLKTELDGVMYARE